MNIESHLSQWLSLITTRKKKIPLARERRVRDNLDRSKLEEQVQLQLPQLKEKGAKERVPREKPLQRRVLQQKAERVAKEEKAVKVERQPKIMAMRASSLLSSSSTSITSHIFRNRASKSHLPILRNTTKMCLSITRRTTPHTLTRLLAHMVWSWIRMMDFATSNASMTSVENLVMGRLSKEEATNVTRIAPTDLLTILPQ